MTKKNSYLIYITDVAATILKTNDLLPIDSINNTYYIPCSDIVDSGYFLKLIIPCAALNHNFELCVPYHYVLYIISAQEKDLDKIPGFQNIPKDSGNLK